MKDGSELGKTRRTWATRRLTGTTQSYNKRNTQITAICDSYYIENPTEIIILKSKQILISFVEPAAGRFSLVAFGSHFLL